MKTNVIFLCVESKAQGNFPNFFVDFKKETLIEDIVSQFAYLEPESFFFVVDNDSSARILGNMYPRSSIISLPGVSKGAACSALYALCQLKDNDAVWVVSTNEYTNVNYEVVQEYFENERCSAGVLSFTSYVPKYAYIRIEDRFVVGVQQYQQISNNAITGVVFFSKIKDAVSAIEEMILKGEMHENGNYYISLSLNQLVLNNLRIGVFEIPKASYIPMKRLVSSC